MDSIRDDVDDWNDDAEEEVSAELEPKDEAETEPQHHSYILGYKSAEVDLRVLHPPPFQIPFLWSIYQDNVEPLLKILHTPTVDAVMRRARKDVTSLSREEEALVFTIYYSAIASQEPEEVNFPSTPRRSSCFASQ